MTIRKQYWPSLGWLVAMYMATGLSEAGPPLHLLEIQRIMIHTVGYAGLGMLMAYAFPEGERRVWLTLIGLAALSGAGQEILQSAARGQVYPWASLFDLGVDMVGAMLGIGGWELGIRKWVLRIRAARNAG